VAEFFRTSEKLKVACGGTPARIAFGRYLPAAAGTIEDFNGHPGKAARLQGRENPPQMAANTGYWQSAKELYVIN
jgi:hypothetical protein